MKPEEATARKTGDARCVIYMIKSPKGEILEEKAKAFILIFRHTSR